MYVYLQLYSFPHYELMVPFFVSILPSPHFWKPYILTNHSRTNVYKTLKRGRHQDQLRRDMDDECRL